MTKIQVLSEETINQIAAGEVIERPLSIVKELLENAIDAGASAVSLEIRDGGIKLIRITDNGSGIDHDDVRTAFLPHATSKIRDARDLSGIHTLGFRGEALSSIAAVASVELITKTPGALMASHYVIEGGEEKEFSEIGAPEGTTFIVRDVFKNVPARRKFLKSPQTEAAKIQDVVEKEALAHPEVQFRFLQDGRQRLATLGNGSLLDVIYSIYGRDITTQLLSVNHQYEKDPLSGLPAVSVHGFIGKPVITRANRNFEIYFVNSRFIRNPMITKAIEDGYHAFLMQHKFPFCVLMIDVNPSIVDVNVHPQKLEVRFSDGMLIYNAIVDSINLSLRQQELIQSETLSDTASPIKDRKTPEDEPITAKTTLGKSSELSGEESRDTSKDQSKEMSSLPHVEPFEMKRSEITAHRFTEALTPDFPVTTKDAHASSMHKSEVQSSQEKTKAGEQVYEDTSAPSYGESISGSVLHEAPVSKNPMQNEKQETFLKGEQETLFTENFLSEEARKQHRIIGQVFDTYWLVEYDDKLFIIDQHAAHEKVNFERMMKRLKEKTPASQYLNPSILVSLTPDEALMLDQYSDYFEKLGYEISNLGGRDYSISAVPADLPELEKKELLLEILDGLSTETGMTTADTIYYKIASMSCKAAVKGNNRLSLSEAQALIDELLTLDNPYACPHGRPTIISISKTEMEKKFKRIV